MLRNHGLLTVGASIPDAFLSMYTFESTCQIQLAAQSGGAELGMIAPEILGSAAEALRAQTSGMGGAFAWPALLRKLNRVDDSYLT
jgi:ribulose-5-phosphate 4-epimerase/fuculose-1-phosphate aldolase